MSKGPGRVQRAIIDLFDQNPGRRFRTSEIAAHVFSEPQDWHLNNIGRALRTLAPTLGLIKCRMSRHGSKGWEHIWGKVA